MAFVSTNAWAQDKLPSVSIASLDGQQVNIQEIQEEGKPMIISFWATWCKPCIKELDAVNEAIEDWKEEVDFQMVAISIDDARSMARVRTLANGRAWDFSVYTDENSDLKRAMGVNNIPHTFIIDAEGNIVWQHASYNIGDEEEYLEVLKNLLEE